MNSERVNVAAVECLSEFGQQDSEYTEDYASVTQRQLSSLTEQVMPTELPAVAPVPKPRYVLHVTSRGWLLFYLLLHIVFKLSLVHSGNGFQTVALQNDFLIK